MKTVLCFGDSLTYGAWDPEGGWVTRLQKFLLKEPGFEWSLIFNLGINGDTTQELLERFDVESGHRIWVKKDAVIFFQVGTNDSQYLVKQAQNAVSLNAYKQNMEMLISKAKLIATKVAILGLPRVDENLVNPMPWEPNSSYRNLDLEKYDECLRTICIKEDVDYLKVSISQELLVDGAHPGAEGHEILSKLVFNYLITGK